MAKTKVVLEFFLPTTKTQVVANCMADVLSMAKTTYDARDVFASYSGPFVDEYVPENRRGNNEAPSNSQPGSGSGDAGGGRSGRGDVGRAGDRDAADARAREDHEDASGEARDEPAEPVKRGRGRPRKQPDGGAEASGKAAGRSEQGEHAEGSRGGEGSGRNVARGADEGDREGKREGEGRSRSAGSSRDADRSSRDEARVKPSQNWDDDDGPDNNTEEGADWWAKTPGDEWPDHLMPEGTLDKAMMGEILSQHFEQSGDREKTLMVLKEVTGERSLPNVHPDDYDKAARALLKDAARIEYGVKR